MRLPIRPASLVAPVLLAVLGCLAAPRPRSGRPPRRLDAFVGKVLADWKTPGVAMAIVKGNDVLLLRGYGSATSRRSSRDAEDALRHRSSTRRSHLRHGGARGRREARLERPGLEVRPASA